MHPAHSSAALTAQKEPCAFLTTILLSLNSEERRPVLGLGSPISQVVFLSYLL